jgi:hypothetical protein
MGAEAVRALLAHIAIHAQEDSVNSSGLSHKFLDIVVMSVAFGSGVVLRELPVNRFAIAMPRASPRQYGSL